MPLRAPAVYPGDQRSFDAWTRSVAVIPDTDSVGTPELKDGQVTYAKFQNVEPLSVVGNSQSTPQVAGPVSAGADNRFLVRRVNALTFDVLAESDIPDTIARDTEVSTAITSAITALKAEADPFPVYLNQTEGDALYVQLGNVLNASATYDPPSLSTASGTTTSVSCTGAAMGDFVLVSFSIDLNGITVTGWVSAADTVSVRFQNQTGSTQDLASGTLRVRVWKQ